jgi:RNA polymerase sigma factor (TIGR02999 family)
MSEVTKLLDAIGQRDPAAADKLLPLVYDELRRMARARMAGERAGHTLQATALVHEAYLRLVGKHDDGRNIAWANRAHFFHAAAEAMRRILIEHARAKAGPVRGGGRCRIPLDVVDLATHADPIQILALDEAISRLEQKDPDAARVVRLRFYAGLSVEEVANAVGVSVRTVKRDWSFARAFLIRALDEG